MENVGIVALTLVAGVVIFLLAAISRGRAIRLKEEERALRRPSVDPVTDYRRSFGTNTVFMSYRRDDAIDVTGRLHDKLVAQFGSGAIFKDIDSIPLGSDFRTHIDQSLRSCKVCLLIVGPRWLGEASGGFSNRIENPRDFVRLEVEVALQRAISVIPILVYGASMPNETSLPESIRGMTYRQAIQLRSDPDFHRDSDRIVSFLKTVL